jgi:tetratricopeptide (TPR) repeat protein
METSVTSGSLRDAALAAYERGDEDAPAQLAAALRSNATDGGLLIAEARALSAAGDRGALVRLRAMLRAAPDWLDGHVALAQLRWEAGESGSFVDEFETALRLLPGHSGLWLRYISTIASSGAWQRAADVARSLRRRAGDRPALRLIEARHAGAAGDLARAGALLESLQDEFPEKRLEEARHRLRLGDAPAASRLLDRVRQAAPPDASVWALIELAWRATGDPRHSWLLDPEAFVKNVDLGLGEAALSRLAPVLQGMHHATGQPLGQSVRQGTQTRGNLWLRAEPEIGALGSRLRSAVAEFATSLPKADPAHPLLADRDRAFDLVTGWSIRLGAGGRHVSHIHAHGVLSSACYIVVPGMAADEAGWLELGRPPPDFPLDLDPIALVEPRAGRLVLFPSYLYHGTRPFSEGERLTVAFDAAPVPRR